MSRMTAMNWRITRQRMKVCEALAEPPRIMFNSPRHSTAKTARTARGLKISNGFKG